MSSIQDKYRRFRQWQENPFDYQDSADRHVCCNCGGEADNNYCPRCGQKAVYGPITWSSVWQGIMDVWGVGTRSLPYSLWQLIWRPGYMIRDYISGKRQVSFPPVKMLVVVALMLVLVNTLLGVDYSNSNTTVNHGSAAFNAKIDVLFDWMTNHIAWTVLMAFSLFIVPVWFLFRQAPRLPRHTLPQGFYIQVLIGVQYLMFMLMVVLLIVLLPSLSGNDGSDATGFMVTLVLPIMLLVDYKQLFGYGWWGTFWRVLVAIPLMLFFGKTIQYMVGFVFCLCVKDWPNMTMYLVNALGMLSVIWLSLEIVHLINKRLWRDGIRVKLLWRPLLALVALILTIVVSIKLGLRTPLDILCDMFGN
ncbi:MAG: DUF3667 domain-containing protein [Muribaculaceae bacterium]|nr:DUF3667 domain-containing protein [Muribaculaceae bacterium]